MTNHCRLGGTRLPAHSTETIEDKHGINIKQLLTFVEVNMFVCRPENPILTEALAEVNIMDIQVCKRTYGPKQKSIIVLLYNDII